MKYSSLAFMTSRIILGKLDRKHDLAKKAVRGAMLSVAISMIPLIIVMHIANSMMYGIVQRLIELDSYHLQLQPVGSQVFSTSDIEKLTTIEHITYAQPEIRSYGILFANALYEGVSIRAVTNDFFQEPAVKKFLRTMPQNLQFNSTKEIIIGEALAQKLSLHIGDTVTLITATQSSFDNFFPRFSLFIVKGIASSGYQPLDGQWIFMSQSAIQRVTSKTNQQLFIGIKTDIPTENLEILENTIADTIQGTYRIYNWKQLNKTMSDSLQSTRTLLIIIMSITVIVAAINILSSLRMMILEKSTEFAILQCIGIQPNDFTAFLFFSGIIIGFLGSIAGIIPGLLLSRFINEIFLAVNFIIGIFKTIIGQGHQGTSLLDPTYYLDRIPVIILWKDVITVIIVTSVLSGMVAMVSVREIVRKKPIETIRQR